MDQQPWIIFPWLPRVGCPRGIWFGFAFPPCSCLRGSHWNGLDRLAIRQSRIFRDAKGIWSSAPTLGKFKSTRPIHPRNRIGSAPRRDDWERPSPLVERRKKTRPALSTSFWWGWPRRWWDRPWECPVWSPIPKCVVLFTWRSQRWIVSFTDTMTFCLASCLLLQHTTPTYQHQEWKRRGCRHFKKARGFSGSERRKHANACSKNLQIPLESRHDSYTWLPAPR